MILSFEQPQLYSQETGSNAMASDIITSLEIIGLKRTKLHVARYPLEKFIGQSSNAFDLNEVEAAVLDTGVLEPKNIELVREPFGTILRVTVEEKWSLFPVPMFGAAYGAYNLGLFLADTNFLGLRDTAVLGGMYGTSGWNAITMYSHTPNKKGIPGWTGFFMYGRRDREDTDKYENLHRRYSIDQLRVSFGLQYPFTDYLSASASVSFTNIALNKKSNALNPPEKGAMLLGFSPGMNLRKSSWDGFLLSQKSLSMVYSYQQGLTGYMFHQMELRGIYEYPFIPGFRMNLRTGLSWRSMTDSSRDLLFEDAPSSAQVDILPNKFVARNYAGFSAGLEKYLFSFGWGTLSVLGSWQIVFSQGPVPGYEFDNGPSGGIRFYLSRLALPAMGIGIAYNMNSGLVQFGLNMGMSM